jgi:hypothetical protein
MEHVQHSKRRACFRLLGCCREPGTSEKLLTAGADNLLIYATAKVDPDLMHPVGVDHHEIFMGGDGCIASLAIRVAQLDA